MAKTYVDERVNTAILDHLPGVLGGGDVRLAVQRNVAEGVAVKELESPLNQSEEAVQDAKDCHADEATDTTLLHGLALGDGTELAEELDNSHEKTAQADGSKAVCQSTLGGTPRRILGEVVDAKVPRGVDAGNGGVDGVLEPLRDPVHGKSHKHD